MRHPGTIDGSRDVVKRVEIGHTQTLRKSIPEIRHFVPVLRALSLI
jgi:hypothetical protein